MLIPSLSLVLLIFRLGLGLTTLVLVILFFIPLGQPAQEARAPVTTRGQILSLRSELNFLLNGHSFSSPGGAKQLQGAHGHLTLVVYFGKAYKHHTIGTSC